MSSKISRPYGNMKTWSKNKGEDHCFSNSDGQLPKRKICCTMLALIGLKWKPKGQYEPDTAELKYWGKLDSYSKHWYKNGIDFIHIMRHYQKRHGRIILIMRYKVHLHMPNRHHHCITRSSIRTIKDNSSILHSCACNLNMQLIDIQVSGRSSRWITGWLSSAIQRIHASFKISVDIWVT